MENESLPEGSFINSLKERFGSNLFVPITGTIGILLLLFGIFTSNLSFFEGSNVEVLEASNEATLLQAQKEVLVEISGAVEKPGVYKILASDRIERLLIEAGGLSAKADRGWVEKNLNRAARVVDGQKIYIPREGEVANIPSGASVSKVAGAQTNLVNLNTATAGELDKLKGIGPTRASAIIENRPYNSIQELVSKRVLSKATFEDIKEQISAP